MAKHQLFPPGQTRVGVLLVPWESVDSESVQKCWPALSRAWDSVFPREPTATQADPDDLQAVLFSDGGLKPGGLGE